MGLGVIMGCICKFWGISGGFIFFSIDVEFFGEVLCTRRLMIEIAIGAEANVA